ncbi:MAG: translation initiation factor IF-2 [Gimesia sp.]
MKIRIFALAKELDYDSKKLIKHCNDAGILVKSSALASISPEEKERLLVYLDSLKQGGAKATASASESTGAIAPEYVAEPAPEKKIRDIRTMAPRPASVTPAKEVPQQEPEAPQESTEVAAEADLKPVPTKELAEESSVEPEPVPVEKPVESVEKDSDKTAEKAVVEAADTVDTPKQKTTEATTAPEVSSVPEPLTPVQEEPMGGASSSRMRDMIPRASLAQRGVKKPKPKPKPKMALPSMAVPPKFQAGGQKKKKDDTPAQKPDVRLTADVLNRKSPLAEHLKKSTEEKHDQSRKGAQGTGDKLKRSQLSSMIDQREQRRQQRKRVRPGSDNHRHYRPRRTRQRRTTPIEYKSSAIVELPITVRSLSESMGRPAKELMTILFKQGIMAKINDSLDEETAVELGIELGVDLEIKRGEDLETVLKERMEAEIPAETLQPRSPIVTILGHVDHGKTTLVDTIRGANVVDGEAGGITQHIAAYQVEHKGKNITFVDTPGHAAFSEMRSRGANVTDIIVLVVAANDGVMPQTIECIAHAKAAGVPLIVALNKIDLPDINEQKVLQELAAHEVLVSEWGGDIELVRVSALNKTGIDDLLETIQLTAELHELKASQDVPAFGVCLEAFQDEGRGPLCWMVIQQGVLRVGDIVVCGTSFGRVRAMFSDSDAELTEALPAMPVKVTGLDFVPEAGSHFFVMEDVEQAREIAEQRIHEGRTESLADRGGPKTLEEILGGSGPKVLPVILKADTPGSAEALRGEIEKFEHDEVKVEILLSGVGGVNESDISLAAASEAIVIAFHVVADDRAVLLAQNEGVEVRRYSIIYEVTEDIKQSLEGLLDPESVEVTTGRAIVLQTFTVSRTGTIAGCRVLNGTIDRNDRVHVIRDQAILNQYSIASLRRDKDDAKQVREGMECGIRLDGFNDVKEGDILEAYRIDKIKRTLGD